MHLTLPLLTLTLLHLLTLGITARPTPETYAALAKRCDPGDGVATDGNQFWADNCDLVDGGTIVSRSSDDGKDAGDNWGKGWGNNNNNNNAGHDSNWNGVYTQTLGCTLGDGVDTEMLRRGRTSAIMVLVLRGWVGGGGSCLQDEVIGLWSRVVIYAPHDSWSEGRCLPENDSLTALLRACED